MPLKYPSGLEDRGRRLWRESLAQWSLSPAHLVLLEEACRLSDRLELLDSIIRRFVVEVNAGEGEFADLTRWLAEARQQSGALKVLLAEIRQSAATKPDGKPKRGASEEAKGVSDLTAKIAARRKASSG
ncbi:hypothetical protein [Streptomyces sp. DW26H14]|uniref:hypothetical protein n=1 Tax=Streptomyces sp. DW26H14 TaxID=3435395 RepID=UPI00403E190E